MNSLRKLANYAIKELFQNSSKSFVHHSELSTIHTLHISISECAFSNYFKN